MSQVLQAGARYLAALDYARRGLPVVPLHYVVRDRRATAVACSCGEPACARVGAHPLPSHGAADATTDPIRLTWWWRRFPDANVGLATGTSFDALIVHGSAGDTARWSVFAQALRSAGPLVRTGGDSWHFLFAPMGLASQRPWGLARPSGGAGVAGWWPRPATTQRRRGRLGARPGHPLPELPAAIAERLEQVGPAEPLTQLVYAQARD